MLTATASEADLHPEFEAKCAYNFPIVYLAGLSPEIVANFLARHFVISQGHRVKHCPENGVIIETFSKYDKTYEEIIFAYMRAAVQFLLRNLNLHETYLANSQTESTTA